MYNCIIYLQSLEVLHLKSKTSKFPFLRSSGTRRRSPAECSVAFTTTRSATNGAGGSMATVLIKVTGNVVVVVSGIVDGAVNANLDPGKQAVLQVIAKVHKLREGVVGVVSLNNRPHVFLVGGDGLLVGVVGRQLLHGRSESLGPEELANVRYRGIPHGDGAVRLDGCVHVREQMRVSGTTLVVTGEDGLELGHAVIVRQLDASEVRAVEPIGSVVARGADSRVNTSGVAVPDVDSHGRDGRAVADVDVLHLEEQGNSVAPLRFNDIGAHLLADDVVRAIRDFGGQNAAGVGAEDVVEGSEHVVRDGTRHVVVDILPSLKRRQVTAVFLRRFTNSVSMRKYKAREQLTRLDAHSLPQIPHLLRSALNSTALHRLGTGAIRAGV